jgi:hypothetical protein
MRDDVTGTVQDQAAQVAESRWFERGVRVGLVAYGVIHLLIAWLALQLAFGERAGAASQQGAMHELAQQPLGAVLLWLLCLGFVCLVGWQLVEAVSGHTKHEGFTLIRKRVGSAGRVVVYAVLAFSAARTALGEPSSSSQDHLTAQVMRLPLGPLLVGAGGAAVIALGGYLAYKGLSRKFEDDLEPGATSGASGSAAVRLGQVGYPAKGVAFGAVGLLFVIAAFTVDPDKAGGLDVALRSLIEQSLGPWVLAAVAVGIGCFGVYCFFWAKYADTSA